jgi:hypothetical protein
MSQKFRDIKTKMLKKQDEMSLIFRDIVNKRGKPSLKGCNVLGTHHPRDA